MRGKQRPPADESVAPVLAGLKGEATVEEPCRRHGISQTTYCKLRDAFSQAGAEGLEHRGHTWEIAALMDRIRELGRMLGRKTLEVEILRNRLYTRLLTPHLPQSRLPVSPDIR